MHRAKLLIVPVLIAWPALGAAAPAFPPAPSFEKRTDYVAWYEGIADVPEGQNAYALYAAFMPGLVDGEADEADWPEFAGMLTDPARHESNGGAHERGQSPGRAPAPWFPTRRGAWEQSHQRTADVRKQFAAAAARKFVVAPPGIEGDKDDNANRLANVSLAHVSKIRQCAMGTLESAWRIGKKGRVSADGFIAGVESALRAAGQLRRSKLGVELMAGYAIRRVAYEQIRWAFAHGVLTPRHAAKLGTMLRKVDAVPMDASSCLGAECAIWLDNIQYMFGPLGGGIKLNTNRYRDVTGSTITGNNRFGLGARVEGDPQGTAAAVLAAYKEMAPHMGPGYSRAHNQALHDIGRGLAQKNNLTKGMLYGMESACAGIYQEAARAEAERRATQVLVELFAYKAANNKWPDKTASLNKKHVGKVLKDPFSNKPFVYMIVDDQPLLYSVGPDGEDDGAAHDDGWSDASDFIFWPIPNSEPAIIASRINRVPEKKLTSFASLSEKLKGKTITISAEVVSISSRPSRKHGERHSIMLRQGKDEAKLFYYADIAGELTEDQALTKGRRIRAIVTVVPEDGKWRLQLKRARDLVHEQ